MDDKERKLLFDDLLADRDWWRQRTAEMHKNWTDTQGRLEKMETLYWTLLWKIEESRQ